MGGIVQRMVIDAGGCSRCRPARVTSRHSRDWTNQRKQIADLYPCSLAARSKRVLPHSGYSQEERWAAGGHDVVMRECRF